MGGQAAPWASSSSEKPLQGPLHLPRPDQASCWGGWCLPSCSVSPRTPVLPGEAAPFLPEALERRVTPPGWEGAPDLMAAPPRGPASPVAGWWLSLRWVKPLAVHTCRDRAMTPNVFQGTLLPGQPDKALGAWSLSRSLPESPVLGREEWVSSE